ncbi:MAG: hypothetical protein RM049_22910 [Nostoc sp. DedQUE04]|nr:hypothetical protein [Nostoc sp. DedQUE04]MDZ8138121.1 hypothetical protein [Nostoc sp. DedQUE04]
MLTLNKLLSIFTGFVICPTLREAAEASMLVVLCHLFKVTKHRPMTNDQ